MRINNNSGAIILGGHVQGLGIIRILGSKGIKCVLIDNTRFNLAKHSRFCKKFYLVADEEILNFLYDLQVNDYYKGWVIFPTNDFHVKILSKNKTRLGSYFKVATDNWDTVFQFYNKIPAYKLAERLKIPTPKTFYPEELANLKTIEIEFPCIIKPAVMHDFYRKIKKKVFICKNRKELEKFYNIAISVIPASEVIVQEIIEGPGKYQYSACFLFLNGKTVVHLTACRMRQHPLDFGNATTYAETISIPVLKEYGEKLLATSNYNGLCEIEFKLDEKDQKYKFLEVNPRTWKWHSISEKSNSPFLPLYFQYLTGKNPEPVNDFSSASFRHGLTDIYVQFRLLLQGCKYWRNNNKNCQAAVWNINDKKPWFFEKLYFLYFLINR